MYTKKIVKSWKELNKYIGDVENLIIECFGREELASFYLQLEYFKSDLAKKGAIIIYDESRLISFGIGIQNFGCEHFLDLGWICSSKDYRGRGLAKEVLSSFEKYWIEESESDFPHLFISNYKELSPFYIKNGFKEIYSHHSKGVLMVKKI